jgi:hypothetical protein
VRRVDSGDVVKYGRALDGRRRGARGGAGAGDGHVGGPGVERDSETTGGARVSGGRTGGFSSGGARQHIDGARRGERKVRRPQ